MKNISKAIIAVMQDVKGMEKNSAVGSGNSKYNGTKDQDVKEVFNEALAKHGLCILPTDIEENTELKSWTEETQWGIKQKQSVFTKVKTKYLLLHESGESIELAGYGHGVDPQDKGAGKATTYALKNCLLYTFLTPVGKIDDTETTHSEEIETPKEDKPEPKKKPSLVVESDEFKSGLSKGSSIEAMEKYFTITDKTKKEYNKQLNNKNK